MAKYRVVEKPLSISGNKYFYVIEQLDSSLWFGGWEMVGTTNTLEDAKAYVDRMSNTGGVVYEV
jgi:hypothetical protein